MHKGTELGRHLLGIMSISSLLGHNYTREVARIMNFILILFKVVQGFECLAKRLGLDPVGSETPLRD